ncbi:MAG: MFS transporter [Gemmatimonadota bacterium]
MSSLTKTPRDVLLALYVPSAILQFCQGLLLPVLPLFALSFEVSYGMVGVVLAAQWVGNLVCDMPVGIAILRVGRKRAMLSGAGLIAASTLALVWAPSLPAVIALRFVSGVGMALWGTSRHSFLAEAVGVERRGRASSVMGGIGRIAAFVAPLPGGLIGEHFGLRAPFALYAVLSLGALAAAARWVPADGPAPHSREAESGRRRFASVVRSHYRILAAAGSGALCAQMIRAGRNAVVPLYAAEVVGLDASGVGLVVSISYGVDMLMFYPAGLVMDRFGRKFAYVPSFAIQSLGMVLIPFTTSLSGLLAAVVLLGLGNGIGAGTMLTLGSDLAPRQARAEFLGIWRFIGDGGSAGGPLVVGRVADAIGLGMAPFVVAAIGLTGAIILLTLVPETLRRPAPTPASIPDEAEAG